MIDWTFVLFAVVLPAIIGFLLGYHRRKPAAPSVDDDEKEDQSCELDDDRLWTENDSLFRPYVGEDVQGFHAGQTGPEQHSDGDPRSREVDAFARETLDQLRKIYPRVTGQPFFGTPEYDLWEKRSVANEAAFEAAFARRMAEKYPPMEHLS